jgi:NUMOD3 motif.
MARQYREASEATKQLQSLRKQGELNPMKNKKHSEESKKLISDKLKLYWQGLASKNDTPTD